MSDHSYNNARAGAESIAAMVAALECDYDRLEELRDERRGLDEAITFAESTAPAERDYPPLVAARAALAEWIEENGEELTELEWAAGDCTSQDDAEQRIQEDPLSIELTGKWTPGEAPEAGGFEILLTTGGPALRIVGELSSGEPYRAWLEHQDWYESWQEYHGDVGAQETLLTYCRQFYFGE